MAPVDRHLGLDWLRIGAFALLVLFHIGAFFIPGHWVVKTMHPIDWAAWPLVAMAPWRLSLLFLVSGFASRALLSKLGSAGSFARSRSMRLLLPLAFGTAVIVAPQGWVRLAQAGYTGSFPDFWLHEWFRFHTVNGVALPATEHLWFVAYLWAYSMGLAAALYVFPAAWKARLSRGFLALGEDYRLLLWPATIIICLDLASYAVPQNGALLTDWQVHSTHALPFLIGFGLAGTPALWSAVDRCWRPALAVTFACLPFLIWAEIRWPGDSDPPNLAEIFIVSSERAAGWSTCLLLLAAAHRWLNRDHPLRRPLAEAVFPVYIVHQTIIVVVGWQIRALGYGAAAEFFILLGSTLLGCWIFYEAGKRIPFLGPLIGLAPRRRGKSRIPAHRALYDGSGS